MNNPIVSDKPSSTPQSSPRKRAVAALLVAVACLGVRWPLLAEPGFKQDQVFFLHWASLAEREGISALYEPRANGKPWCNYPPLYPYVLRGLAGIYRLGAGESLHVQAVGDVIADRDTPIAAAATALFKMPGVIADGVTCALLALWLSRRVTLHSAILVASAYALMPAVIFDSAVWGQVDSIPTLFSLIALECTTRRRWASVGVFAALAMLAKPQAVIFAPLLVFAAIYAGPPRVAFALLRIIVGAAATSLVILTPLWSARAGIAAAYTDAAGHYPYVHLNGFSTWFLANPLSIPRLDDLAGHYRRDDQGGAPPRYLGLAVMGLLTFGVLIRVANSRANGLSIRLASRVLPLAFVVVCTQMHERYLIPALACWAWAYQASMRWWLGWVVMGGVAFLNLLWVWEQPLAIGAVTSLAEWTRSAPGGIPTGVYGAIALLLVLLMTLTGFDQARSEREFSDAPSAP